MYTLEVAMLDIKQCYKIKKSLCVLYLLLLKLSMELVYLVKSFEALVVSLFVARPYMEHTSGKLLFLYGQNFTGIWSTTW